MSATIAVDQLRVGMYIHLDGGWLSHPFPLSSFKIASADQIQTLRGLKLSHVRWSPEKSDLAESHDTDAAHGAGGAAGNGAQPSTSAEALATARRAEWLAEQREAAQRCERQYGEAAKTWREMCDAVAAQPHEAGRTSEALTRAMLDKMLAAQDIGIRLVNGGGDRAAAHALNVSIISMLIGRTLGLSEAEMMELGTGALLHDVGKLDVPDRFRHQEDGFSAAELNAYRDHVAKGVLHGQRMAVSAGALAVIAQHHEHADGSGFPARLVADRMAVAARIVAIVNRYDNLCNPSTRTLALTPHEAVAMLFAQGRSRYDAPVLNAFIRMMGVYPAGSLVQLTDDRYALVVGVNSTRPLKPRVLVHDTPRGVRTARGSGAPEPGAELIDLETLPDLGIRRSLQASKLPPAALQALDPRPRVSYYFEPLQSPEQAQGLAGQPRALERAA
jgi:HD-GYP domain-containing protein (c-di-GMP phosphodiesterase class II)